MRDFARLFEALDQTMATGRKVDLLAEWLRRAPPGDAAWAVHFLAGGKLKRLVPQKALWELTLAATGLPDWLVGECQASVGDLAETVALLLDAAGVAQVQGPDLSLESWVEDRLLPLAGLPEPQQRARLADWWLELDTPGRFLLLKLLTGELRVGVSNLLVERAIAQATGLPAATVAGRRMGTWRPSAQAWQRLVAPEASTEPSTPYPFFLASPLEGGPERLGDRADWQAEWKWDGIRAQVVRRAGQVWLWSRGEELVTTRFPEVAAAALALADGTVLDGELLAWRDGTPLGFAALQRRIGKLQPSVKLRGEVPVALLAYDLLEQGGVDLRPLPLRERRARLEALLGGDRKGPLQLSKVVTDSTWQGLAGQRERSRELGVEGLMLKHLDSPYEVGRQRGNWWKWKIDPHTVDAVLIHAEAGRGKRANLYTAYTFACWQTDAATGEDRLVPVARAYTGLDQAEIAELDRWIRAHTLERFGPVRVVQPVHVFELAFEGIQASARHKSGIAVRFPRIVRWRRDKPAAEADRVETLRALVQG